jgi:hypothetical protein
MEQVERGWRAAAVVVMVVVVLVVVVLVVVVEAAAHALDTGRRSSLSSQAAG